MASSLLLAPALLFGYLNGLTDSANIIAPVISCRVMSPRRARLMAAAAMAIAPFIFGVAAAAGVILGAAFLGGPVSTTHVVSAAVLGAGAAERVTRSAGAWPRISCGPGG